MADNPLLGSVGALNSAYKDLQGTLGKLESALPLQALSELESAQNNIGAQVANIDSSYEDLDRTIKQVTQSSRILSRIQATELFNAYKSNIENIRFTNEQLKQHIAILTTSFPSAYKMVGAGIETFIAQHGDLAKAVMSGKFNIDVYTEALHDHNAAMVAYEEALAKGSGRQEKLNTIFGETKAFLKDISLELGKAGGGWGAWISGLLEVIGGAGLLKKGLGSFGSKAAADISTQMPLGWVKDTASGHFYKEETAGILSRGPSLMARGGLIGGGLLAGYGIGKALGLPDLIKDRVTATMGELEIKPRVEGELALLARQKRYGVSQMTSHGISARAEGTGSASGDLLVAGMNFAKRETAIDDFVKGNQNLLNIDEKRLRIMDLMKAPTQARMGIIQHEVTLLKEQEDKYNQLLEDVKKDPRFGPNSKQAQELEMKKLDVQAQRLEKVNFVRRSMLEGMMGGYMGAGTGGGNITPGALSLAQTEMSGYTQGAMQVTGKGGIGTEGMMKSINPDTGKVEDVGANTKGYSQWMQGFGVGGTGQPMPKMMEEMMGLMRKYLPAIEQAAGNVKLQ